MAGITVRELVVKLEVKGDAKKKLNEITAATDQVKKAFLAVSAAAVATGAAVFALVDNVTKIGDELAKTSRSTGITAREFQRLSFVADRSGVPIGNMIKGLQNIGRNMRDAALAAGTGQKTGFSIALEEVGLRLEDLTKLGFEDRIGLIGEALSRVADTGRRVALSQKLIGEEAGPKFASLILEGRAGIAKLGDEFERLGFVMDKDALNASEAFQDSMTRLTTVAIGVKNAVGVGLIPVVEKVVKSFTKWLLVNRKVITQGAEKFVKKLSDGFDVLIENADDIVRNMGEVLDLFIRFVSILADMVEGVGGLTNAIKIATVAFVSFKIAMIAGLGPVGLLVTGLVGLAVAFSDIKTEADLAREAQDRFNRGAKEQVPLDRKLAKANAARLAADIRGGKALTPALEQSLVEASSLQLQETLKVAAKILKGGRRATGKRFGPGEFSGFSSQVRALQRKQRTAGADIRTLNLIRESIVLDRARAQAQKRPTAAKVDEPVFGIAGTELDPGFDFRPSRLPTKPGEPGAQDKQSLDELIADAIRSGKLPEEAALLASTQPPIIIPITNNNFDVDVQAPVTLTGIEGETAEELSGRFSEMFERGMSRVLIEALDVLRPKAAR